MTEHYKPGLGHPADEPPHGGVPQAATGPLQEYLSCVWRLASEGKEIPEAAPVTVCASDGAPPTRAALTAALERVFRWETALAVLELEAREHNRVPQWARQIIDADRERLLHLQLGLVEAASLRLGHVTLVWLYYGALPVSLHLARDPAQITGPSHPCGAEGPVGDRDPGGPHL